MANLISLNDLSPATVAALVRRAVEFGDPRPVEPVLAGKRIGIYFSKPSTRTRSSFWAAATRLGASTIAYGPDDLQLTTGETWEDTARVLAQYLDVLVVRTNGDKAEMRGLSGHGLAVVNALSRDEHPTQALADLATLAERFGSLDGVHLLYVGEGNSSAAALALATALTPGLRLTVLTPHGYGLDAEFRERAARLGAGDRITETTDVEAVDAPVDAVYTSRWQTMGVPKADPRWRRAFDSYQVNRRFMDRVGGPGTAFLHDLPAVRGQEVTDEVLDGPGSIALRQAHHKMTAAMAVLQWCALDTDDRSAPVADRAESVRT